MILIEHLFICLLTVRIPSYVKWLCKSFAHFKIELLNFFLMISSFFIQSEYESFVRHIIVNIFTLSRLIFSLFMVYFDKQKSSISMKSRSFMVSSFGVLFKKSLPTSNHQHIFIYVLLETLLFSPFLNTGAIIWEILCYLKLLFVLL